MLIAAVKSLTGIDVNNYVIIENRAIPNIVSALGAVEFEVPIDMNSFCRINTSFGK